MNLKNKHYIEKPSAAFLWDVAKSLAKTHPKLSHAVALELRTRFQVQSLPPEAVVLSCPRCAVIRLSGETCSVSSVRTNRKMRRSSKRLREAARVEQVVCKSCGYTQRTPTMSTKEESRGKRKRKRRREWLNKSQPVVASSGVDTSKVESIKEAADLGRAIAGKAFAWHLGDAGVKSGSTLKKVKKTNASGKEKKTKPKPKSSLQAFFDTLQG